MIQHQKTPKIILHFSFLVFEKKSILKTIIKLFNFDFNFKHDLSHSLSLFSYRFMFKYLEMNFKFSF
jgi:hypothetical protein